MADDVLFEKRPDGVAIITLNRPDRMNAMGGQLMPMLAQYLDQCRRDSDVRAVVLTGAGRAFCAGGDVKAMGRRPNNAESGKMSAGGLLVSPARATHNQKANRSARAFPARMASAGEVSSAVAANHPSNNHSVSSMSGRAR